MVEENPFQNRKDNDQREDWVWHAKCVEAADAAYARGDRKAWREWSQRAAEVIQKIAGCE